MRADVLVGSVVLHGAALALFVHWLPGPPLPDVLARTPVDVRAATPVEVTLEAPLEVALIDPPAAPVEPPAAPAASRITASAGSRANPSRAPERAVGTERPGEAAMLGAGESRAPGTSTDGQRPATGLFRMRGADLALAPGVAEHIAAGGEPLHDGARRSGKLENVSGGSAVIHDRVTTVTVDRDGTAHFADKPDIDVKFHSPIPHFDFKADMHALGDALQDWYNDPYAGTRYGPSTDLSEANHAVAGMCDTWSDPGCDDPLAPESEKRARHRADSSVGVHGSADLTAYLYRKLARSDPYASRKLRLLDDTRAERVERGEKFRAEQASRSAELMQRTLEQLWAGVRDPAARKTALFELWQDCGDDEAGTRARAMVLGWIRAKLPAGSPGAYTADEQARLGFSPYDDVELSVVSP